MIPVEMGKLNKWRQKNLPKYFSNDIMHHNNLSELNWLKFLSNSSVISFSDNDGKLTKINLLAKGLLSWIDFLLSNSLKN